jgi:hypothetical protein
MSTRPRASLREPRALLGHKPDDELLMFELAGLVAGRDQWPTRQEFIEAGSADLFWKVHRAGGPARWASEFGLAFEPEPDPERPSPVARQPRREPRESRQARRERLIRELEVFCSGREYFPSNADWKAVGRTDLQAFIRRNGGVHEWSARMGLPLRSIQNHRPYSMAQAVIAGRSVLSRYGRIPSRATLAAVGEVRLHTFIQNEFGGDRDAFAERCR